jgi:hypothetical protein
MAIIRVEAFFDIPVVRYFKIPLCTNGRAANWRGQDTPPGLAGAGRRRGATVGRDFTDRQRLAAVLDNVVDWVDSHGLRHGRVGEGGQGARASKQMARGSSAQLSWPSRVRQSRSIGCPDLAWRSWRQSRPSPRVWERRSGRSKQLAESKQAPNEKPRPR